jgi:hypothetical protein
VLLTAVLFSGCHTPPVDRRQFSPEKDAEIKRGLMVPGEKLTYNISGAGIRSLGKAELAIKASETDKDILHLSLFANSTHPWFPSLSYTYRSTVRKNDFSTLSFQMEQTRKSEIEKTVQFRPDYKTRTAAYSMTQYSSTSKGKLNFDNTVYDALSILYFIRTSLPEIGRNLEVPLFHEKQIMNVKVQNLTERDIVLDETGRFTAYIFKPRHAFEGIFVRRGKVFLWLDSTYGIPLKIILKLPFGVGIIELIKAENTQTGDVFIP